MFNFIMHAEEDLLALSAILEKEISSNTEEEQTFYEEAGRVISIADGVAKASGLLNVTSGEVVMFSKGVRGMVLNLERNSVGIIVLGDDKLVTAGDIVVRTGRVLDVPVGFSLLGRVLDAAGNPIDGDAEFEDIEYSLVEVKAPGVITRQPVREPLETGVKAVDILLPIGRGQRELIIGDRQTGKTAIAIDAIINQARINNINVDEPVYCIYVAIGQRQSLVLQLKQTLIENNALDNTIIVSATASVSSSTTIFSPICRMCNG